MAKARTILKRAKAAKSIRTVTKTMEMVASSRFKKCHDMVVASRPYTSRLGDLVGDMIDRCDAKALHHPLLQERAEVKRDVLLVLTSNRGLCGGFNGSIVRTATERSRQMNEAGYDVLLQVHGKRGIQQFRFLQAAIDKEYVLFDDVPNYRPVSQLADAFIDEYLAGRIGGVEVAYMQFLSASRQKPAIAQILPLTNLQPPRRTHGYKPAYEFMPSADVLLEELLPATVRLRLYQCFLDSAASEQVIRIAAMRSATDNADDMIQSLTVRYNRVRQAQITTELAEIMGGRMGLEEK
ncbi:MAG: ATP synthase gamma chain [Planctomycetes bacterium ADurb.Bin126]|nr:MAG: ATP synthase gamma chain [Planctomycetes bacterium ADurb.Bin126]HOD83223.1 ATP synthase F1 subunit gamma [Phycisphaerae bacterium]HQL71895.1 ATP synthase F1 subunit gamma [Phycisphaerae bacterium]